MGFAAEWRPVNFFYPSWYHQSGCFLQQGLGMSPYPPRTGRSWQCKLFLFGWLVSLRHSSVARVGKLWTVLVLWKCRVLSCLVCWFWCGLVGRQRSLIFSEMRRVTVLSAHSSGCQLNFVNSFYSNVWDRISPEEFGEGGIHDWLKKYFLIVSLFLHFNQLNAWSLLAQKSVLFILI